MQLFSDKFEVFYLVRMRIKNRKIEKMKKFKKIKNKKVKEIELDLHHVHAVSSGLRRKREARIRFPNYSEHLSKPGKLNKTFPFLTDKKVAIIDPCFIVYSGTQNQQEIFAYMNNVSEIEKN